MVPGIPWCGHTSERTGNPGNQESGLGEGTGTRPDYLVNRDDKKIEGPFVERIFTKIEK